MTRVSSADSSIQLTVSPLNQFAPGSIQLTVRMAPDAANRELCYGLESEDAETRRSCLSLNGEAAPSVIRPSRYTNLSAGEYVAYAELARATPIRVLKHFTVIPSMGGP